MKVPFYKPSLGIEEYIAIGRVLESGWLSTGQQVEEFEKEFLKYMKISGHAVATNSGTAALHLAMDLLDLEPNDVVLMPTLTFAATAEVVTYYDASIRLIDSDPVTLNLSLEHLEEVLEKESLFSRIKALIVVHYAGCMVNMEKVKEIIEKFRSSNSPIWIIEDAAHCTPAAYYGKNDLKYVGTESDAACFSFYPTKPITTGQGGMLTTQKSEWSIKAREARSHGLSTNAWEASTKNSAIHPDVKKPGFKYNMTNIAAAMGLEQLKKADNLFELRTKAAKTYSTLLKDFSKVKTPPDVYYSSWHLYVIRLNENCKVTRDHLIEKLKKRKIGCAVNWKPLHMHSYYSQFDTAKDLPVATKAFEQILSLPLFPNITKEQIEVVVTELVNILK